MFYFGRYSLARRFMLVSLVIFLAGMLVIGFWVSEQIKRGVINRTAAVTSLYVESLLTHHLRGIEPGEPLDNQTRHEIEQLFLSSRLGGQIVSFKLWSPAGEVLYSPQPGIIGQQFDNPELQNAVASTRVVSNISKLDEAENEFERRQWERLIETYAPLQADSGDIIAVAEFYQTPDALLEEVKNAQRRSWLVVGVATVLMYLALNGMVGQASHTILDQQAELERNIDQLEGVLAQNKRLHERVRRAAARTTTLNEQFLRRVSSDLHDGPAQDVSLALLRLIHWLLTVMTSSTRVSSTRYAGRCNRQWMKSAQFRLDYACRRSASCRQPTQCVAPCATTSANRAWMCSSLLNPSQEVFLPVRITLYRIVQEALSNSYQHAGGAGQAVHLTAEGSTFAMQVNDTGPGFDLSNQAEGVHLGLAGMRERVEMLGGTFEIQTGAQGTIISVHLPLAISEISSMAT